METKQERNARLIQESRDRSAELLAEWESEHRADLVRVRKSVERRDEYAIARQRARDQESRERKRKSSTQSKPKLASLSGGSSVLTKQGRVLVANPVFGSIELSMGEWAPKKKPRPLSTREKQLQVMLAEERVSRRAKG